MSTRIDTVKYWAGQKLLHSPFHLYYLKLTGKVPRPRNYDEWLMAEGPRGGPAELPKGYRVVLPPGARLAPDAIHWFTQAIAESHADVLYADEDILDSHGGRCAPVFKPAWSPELFKRCDYLGGAYVLRQGAEPGYGHTVHVPRVLFHRAKPATYEAQEMPEVPTEGLVSVIVCSRTPALAAACLGAVRARTAMSNYELVLVDHDAGMETIAERFGARRIGFRGDFNFALMCNTGARAASGDLVLFLNDDTVPLEPQWMGRMAAHAANPEVGAVGSMLTFPDGRIQHSGVYIGTPNGAGHPGRLTRGRSLWPWLQMTREQSAVTGACMMLRRDLFQKLGGFDERFPNNYNDVDLCLKCREAGFKVVVETEARLEHRESATRKTGIRYDERKRFFDLWGDVIERRDPYLNPNLSDDEDLLPDPDAFGRVCRWR